MRSMLTEFTGYYVDAHSHRKEDGPYPRIVSADPDEFDSALAGGGHLSVGIHPWKVRALGDLDEALERLRALAVHERVVAVGECGLDRLTEGFPAEQEALFVPQMKLAEALGKPLIVHCVRAFGELIRLHRTGKVSVPIMVHGYNGNRQIAEELIRKGFYISLGAALLKPGSNAARLASVLPVDRLFLETDDTGLAIGAIYEAAARLWGLPIAVLKEALYTNFRRVFLPCS